MAINFKNICMKSLLKESYLKLKSHLFSVIFEKYILTIIFMKNVFKSELE